MVIKTDFRRFGIFAALNWGLALFLSAFFLFYTGGHPLELAFAFVALLSNTVMLAAAAALPAALLYLVLRHPAAPGAVFWAFQLWLAVDLAVYKIFRFHLNSMVLNLVLTPGGLESLDQGWLTRAVFAMTAAVLAAAQWYFWRLAGGEGARRSAAGRRPLALALALLSFVLADKVVYAWADLRDFLHVTRNAGLFPLYQPLTIRDFAVKRLGVRLDAEVRGGIDPHYSGLDYPKAPLVAEPPARPLNFLFIVVDSLRADMLTPEVMPETWAFARRASVFEKHYSGGNATRFGVFSMLYGLYGNYWFPMLGERRGPVFLSELKRQGYDLRVYASAPLTFPEFNKTCFVEVPVGNFYDRPPGANGIEKDRDISERFISYLQGRDRKRPYFAFIFYDASHGSYDAFPELEKFRPSVQVNHLNLNLGNVGGMFNRYKNSILSDDSLAGRILRAVESSGGLRDTVVVITGDHGEAFLERGRVGHNQGYSPEELRVPLVLHVPGRRPLRSQRITSHLDIVPTLMPLAGVKNPPADYSCGVSLFGSDARKFVPAGSWDSAGLITGDAIIEMPLAAYRRGVRVFDTSYREQPRGAASRYSGLIMDFQKEAGRFLK